MQDRKTKIRNRARPLLSVAAGLAVAGLVMLATGYHPIEAFGALWTGATGLSSGPAASARDLAIPLGPRSAHLNTYLLAQSLARATPLLFTGLAVALGLRAGLFNIGAQGQMTMGALMAAAVGEWGVDGKGGTGLPTFVHIPLVLLAGAAAGALWAALPGLLKSIRGVHEVITTIMLNYVALDVAGYLATHDWKDPHSMAVQTGRMARSAWLPAVMPGSNLTPGLLLALACAAGIAFLLGRTALGYRIRAVGLGAEAARTAGISVGRTIVVTMALSGALAGLAGAVEVMGVHHRYVDGVAGSYGFDGIAVALLGGLSGGGVVVSALFFAGLASGAAFMQLQTRVPAAIAVMVQAIIILFAAVRLQGKLRTDAPQTGLPAARERSAPIDAA